MKLEEFQDILGKDPSAINTIDVPQDIKVQFFIVKTVERDCSILGPYQTLEDARSELLADVLKSYDCDCDADELRDVMQESDEYGDFGGTPNSFWANGNDNMDWNIFAMLMSPEKTAFQKLS